MNTRIIKKLNKESVGSDRISRECEYLLSHMRQLLMSNFAYWNNLNNNLVYVSVQVEQILNSRFVYLTFMSPYTM